MLRHWFQVLSINTARLMGKLSNEYWKSLRLSDWVSPFCSSTTSLSRYLSNVPRLIPFGNSTSSGFCNRTCASNIPSTWTELWLGKMSTWSDKIVNFFYISLYLQERNCTNHTIVVLVVGYVWIGIYFDIFCCQNRRMNRGTFTIHFFMMFDNIDFQWKFHHR